MTDQALARSAMYDVQAAMGATFTSFWGWIWTESFGDVIGEHRAIREGVGAADVSSLIEWEWTGPDSLVAAQRACTNDILGLSVGQIRYGPFLDANGKMIDDATVFRLADDRCWVMTNRWDLQEHFAEVTHGLDVTIKDVTLEMPLIQVQGPRSRELLSKLTPIDLAPLKYFRFIPEKVEIGGVPVWISRTGFHGRIGLRVVRVTRGCTWALVDCGRGRRDALWNGGCQYPTHRIGDRGLRGGLRSWGSHPIRRVVGSSGRAEPGFPRSRGPRGCGRQSASKDEDAQGRRGPCTRCQCHGAQGRYAGGDADKSDSQPRLWRHRVGNPGLRRQPTRGISSMS